MNGTDVPTPAPKSSTRGNISMGRTHSKNARDLELCTLQNILGFRRHSDVAGMNRAVFVCKLVEFSSVH
jgi:hypothetical protein